MRLGPVDPVDYQKELEEAGRTPSGGPGLASGPLGLDQQDI